MIKRLAAIFAALGLTLAVVAPAFAVEIHQTLPISSSDAQFQSTDCSVSLQSGQVDWHFVLVQSDKGDPTVLTNNYTLTATFATAGTFTVYPDKVVDSYVLHYDIVTGTDTLISASTSGGGANAILNLSSICNGGPPPQVPEAPLTVLLVLTAGLTGLGFVGWRMRQNRTIA